MSLKDFRAYSLAIEFYKQTARVRCSRTLKDQMERAASSIALNLSEGSAKESSRERRRFYYIALGSLRECQAVLDLVGTSRDADIFKQANDLGGVLYKLCKSLETGTDARS